MSDFIKSQIINAIKEEPLVKSKLIKKINNKAYCGYKDNIFISYCYAVKRNFNKLVDNGTIIFKPGEPVALR